VQVQYVQQEYGQLQQQLEQRSVRQRTQVQGLQEQVEQQKSLVKQLQGQLAETAARASQLQAGQRAVSQVEQLTSQHSANLKKIEELTSELISAADASQLALEGERGRTREAEGRAAAKTGEMAERLDASLLQNLLYKKYIQEAQSSNQDLKKRLSNSTFKARASETAAEQAQLEVQQVLQQMEQRSVQQRDSLQEVGQEKAALSAQVQGLRCMVYGV
jgi:hypothetical protein